MFVVISLDVILFALGILMMLGFASAISLGVWLLNHALIIGIIFVVIRGLSTYFMMLEYECNWFCSLLYFLTSPIIIIAQYFELRAVNNGIFTMSDSIEMLLLSIFLFGIDALWAKAAEKDTMGLFTVLYMAYIFYALFLHN